MKRRSHKIVIDTTPDVVELLGDLVRTGLFGETVEECAEELVRAKIRELVDDGWPSK